MASKRCLADFKAKVALGALRGDLEVAQLAIKYTCSERLFRRDRNLAVDGGVKMGRIPQFLAILIAASCLLLAACYLMTAVGVACLVRTIAA